MPLLRRCLAVPVAAVCLSSYAAASEVELNGKQFTIADGFTLELAAGIDLTSRPICVDFDDQGRLYVAESSGTNDPVQKQLEDKPHSILRLEDTNGDGVFDRRSVFADRLMFPEGCEWHDGSLYVSAPPQIWKLTDADDDGVAEQREVWFDGKTLTGCANDLHGPYTGPDGLLYWCKGAFAEQTYPRTAGEPFVTRASHIFRHDPTTGDVEPILTGGMDNPVEVAFTRDGEPFMSCTFFQMPAGGNRDGLIHAVYGGVWGKNHGVLDGHPRTGDLMPPLVHLGAAAPCGLARPEDESWGRDEVLLAASFNLHKVSRHVLRPSGATFTTIDDDLLTCADVDFHPTDVIEDADGSLLVVDTGGWYKLCCPTSQLHKPDVPGAIYRLRRTDARRMDDPRGVSLNWLNPSLDELGKRLHDPRFAVRQRALDEAVTHDAAAVPLLSGIVRDSESAEARRLALWGLTRISSPEARVAVRESLAADDNTVQRIAARSAGLWRDAEAVDSLRGLLSNTDPHTRRVAAEALSRLKDPAAVADLLKAAAGAAEDRFLHHAITYALIRTGDADQTRAGLASQEPGTVRAALLALDQMSGGNLTADALISRLDSDALRDTLLFLLERHPEFDETIAAFLGEQLSSITGTTLSDEDLRNLAARFAARPAVNARLAALASEGPTAQGRQIALEAMNRKQKLLPAEWTATLIRVLKSGDANAVRLAIDVAGSAEKLDGDATTLKAALREVAATETVPADTRLLALRTASGGTNLDQRSFDYLVAQLGPDHPVGRRLLAADVCAAAILSPEQMQALADVLPDLGPMELDRVLPVFAKASDEATGARLIAALEKTDAAADVAPEKLLAAFAKFGPKIAEAARPILERPQADAESRRARLDEMLALVATGDARRGQAIFQSSRAACASCHALGYLGGRVGPDLTRIGQIRTERDLLEAILFPSASFVRSYEPVVVLTVDGQVHNGVPREEAGDSITLAIAADKTVSVARDEIEEMRPGTISIMPAGLEKQLTPQELADLVVFLKTAR